MARCAPLTLGLAAVMSTLALAVPGAADVPPSPGPCGMPAAVTLADRPGTGRTASSGGSPCVVPLGEIVIESGARRQITTGSFGSITLASVPLTFLRAGIAPRVELGVAPPAGQSRAITGMAPVDAARGLTDMVVATKVLVLNTPMMQGSLGASYAPPTGTGEFTAGAPTYSVSANLAVTLTPALTFAMTQLFGTSVGAGANGANQTFFVWAPSYTLGLALDANDTLIVQDALVSRQGPVLPMGSRGFIAFQRALSNRLAVDFDYEINLAPTLGSAAHALGFGFVWIAAPRRR